MSEIRWYKGKYQVRIIQRSNVGVKGKHLIRNMLVEALEPIRFSHASTRQSQPFISDAIAQVGDEFTTVPRLLWRHPRKEAFGG